MTPSARRPTPTLLAFISIGEKFDAKISPFREQTVRRIAVSSLLALGLVAAALRIAGASRASTDESKSAVPILTYEAQALGAIVGEWQSDTVGGVSARTSCAWSPYHAGVLCEQHLTTPKGATTALDLFTSDSASKRYNLYVLQKSGEPMTPVPFTIAGSRWTYGGTAASADGRYYRTVNEFRDANAYTWRQEVSSDGKAWSEGIHGKNLRVRR